ncbi:MAG: hypothetical protein ACK5NT_11165 [Pyrinomonadaceae bacterium]
MQFNLKLKNNINIQSFAFFALLFALTANGIFAQSTLTESNRDSSKPVSVTKVEERNAQVLEDSGRYFNQGLYSFIDKNSDEARKQFDSSVEVFLKSGINVERNTVLRECYNSLIETVFRIEFPDPKQPADIRTLSAVCSWNLKGELADDVAKAIVSVPLRDADNPEDDTASVDSSTQTVGFGEQKFEPSPLDELSKLELNADETNVETPEAQMEYEYIRVAVEKNRSLGFTFQMHQMVQQFINYYRGRGRRTMEVGLYRSGMFMSMIRRIFREEGIPENIAWLAQVESGW